MISSTRQALACIFVFLSVAVIAHAQITPATEPGATITGKVTLKGKGVPGIVVTVRANNSSRPGREYSGPKGVSDDEGNYRIVNVPPGNYRVIPVVKPFVPAEDADREKVLIVNKGDTIDHIDFAVLGGGVITGKVVDAEGRPVVEESVYVFDGPPNGNVYQQSYSLTDDRGVYRIYGLRPGSYKVAAGRGEESFHSGVPRPYKRTFHPSVEDPLQATIVEVTEGGETKDVDITFSRRVSTYSASGRVVDGESGQPLANVSYGITRFEAGGSSGMSDGSVTNSRGEFKFAGLSPGKYAVTLSLSPDSDLLLEELRFEITDQDVTGLVVKSTSGGSISGVVVFEDVDAKTLREQGNGTWITASTEGTTRSRGSSVRVGEDGSFHLRGLAGGTINFFLYANQSIRIDHLERDGVIQPRGIVLREREHLKGIRVVAEYGSASIRGKIEVQNGSLPPDGRFYYWLRKIGEDSSIIYSGSNMPSQVDARGNFVIDRLTAGTYEIEAGVGVASAKASYTAKKQQVVVTAGTTTNVTMTVDLSSTPYKQP